MNNPSNIQKRIEYLVTNGLGYNSQTKFLNGREDLSLLERFSKKFLKNREENIKNTFYGLRTHLFEMEIKIRMPLLTEKEIRKSYSLLRSWKELSAGEASINSLKILIERMKLPNLIEEYILKESSKTNLSSQF